MCPLGHETAAASNVNEFLEALKRDLIIKEVGDYQHISTKKREQMLLIGLELEFCGFRTTFNAEETADYIKQYWNNLGIKIFNTYDGSLEDNGREIKFPPMTESAYKALEFAWLNTFNKLRLYGFNDPQRKAGGHLHIAITTLGKDLETRKNNMRRLVEWFYANREAVQKFAGRTGERWAEIKPWTADYLDDRFSNARYRAVNFFTGAGHRLSGAKTFEIRIFDGYKTSEQLLANVEFVKALTNTLNGQNARVLENYDFNALMFNNRRNAPHAFAHWLSLNPLRR